MGVQYTESNLSVYDAFAQTGMWTIIYRVSDVEVLMSLLGDWMSNARPNLETVINAGVSALYHWFVTILEHIFIRYAPSFLTEMR